MHRADNGAKHCPAERYLKDCSSAAPNGPVRMAIGNTQINLRPAHEREHVDDPGTREIVLTVTRGHQAERSPDSSWKSKGRIS